MPVVAGSMARAGCRQVVLLGTGSRWASGWEGGAGQPQLCLPWLAVSPQHDAGGFGSWRRRTETACCQSRDAQPRSHSTNLCFSHSMAIPLGT